MTKLIIVASLMIAIGSGCKSNNNKQSNKEAKPRTLPAADTSAPKNLKEVTPQFADVDPALSAAIKKVVDDYLQIKDALANNDESKARSIGKDMADALHAVDKGKFTAAQKKIYEAEEDELNEDAEHIGKSKIEHQREHFSMLSESLYNVIIAFGGGRPLYEVDCNAAEKEGAMWLTATADNKNPYLGNKGQCFHIREKIK